MTSKQVRVMMWSTPRSVSTAIERSIITLDEAEVFNEMYSAAHHFGPSNYFPLNYLSLSPNFTFKWVKSELEKDYSDKKVIFAKDFAYALKGDLSSLPCGFTHTILIRNPRSVFNSLKRVMKKSIFLRWFSLADQFSDILFFKHLWELFIHARENSEQTPIVIDADDFVKDPEAMMKLYCRKTGIPFKESMLKWEPTNIWNIRWHCSYALSIAGWLLGYYSSILSSCGFQRCIQADGYVESEIDDDEVNRAAAVNMKYYNMLYANRLRPEENTDN